MFLYIFIARDYVAGIETNQGLVDKISQKTVSDRADGINVFPPHLTPLQLQDGIRSGRLLQGTFHQSRDNYLEGSVNVEGRDQFVGFHFICCSLCFEKIWKPA